MDLFPWLQNNDKRDAVVSALMRPMESAAAPPPSPKVAYWPDASDLALSKTYDTMYGSPYAPNAEPRNAYVGKVPLASADAWYGSNDLKPRDATVTLNTEADADRMRELAIAAERSAVAKLGFNPGLMFSTPPREYGSFIGFRGMYKPKSNVAWYDEAAPAAGIHESMHRGLTKLGITPGNQEALVRALMQRTYGDIESKHNYPPGLGNSSNDKQIEEGKKLANSKQIDELEKKAAEEIARKHPRGPR